jgi:hypothetical protein
MTDQAIPTEPNTHDPARQNRARVTTSGDVDIEELAKEIWNLLKRNLREENERIARK